MWIGCREGVVRIFQFFHTFFMRFLLLRVFFYSVCIAPAGLLVPVLRELLYCTAEVLCDGNHSILEGVLRDGQTYESRTL